MYVRDSPQFMQQTDAKLQHSNRPWLPPSTFGLLTVLDLSGSTYAVETASLRNEWQFINNFPCHSKLHRTFSDSFPVSLIPREINEVIPSLYKNNSRLL